MFENHHERTRIPKNAQETHIVTRLNERKAAELKPRSASYEVRDCVARGLILRVGIKGRKVWEVVTPDGRSANGRPTRKRKRLGTFPELSVKDARKAGETAKLDGFRLGASRGEKTVRELFGRYKATKVDQMRSFNDVESVWRFWADPLIGDVRVADLSIYHGIELRDHIAANSSSMRAASLVFWFLVEWQVWAGLAVLAEWTERLDCPRCSHRAWKLRCGTHERPLLMLRFDARASPKDAAGAKSEVGASLLWARNRRSRARIRTTGSKRRTAGMAVRPILRFRSSLRY